ncbi:MAG: extracellular solute-binding protein, partial [Proteobacteria bacterium]|nr:extracellular solute-binding protein [Pseudomonadota bacterium]
MKHLFAMLAMVLWATTAMAEDVTLWHAYRGAEEAALKQAIEAYRDETGVSVKAVPLPFEAFDSKVETAIPRGNGPDLLIAGHPPLAKWHSLGIVQETGNDGLAHHPKSNAALTLDGKQYGFPLANKTLVLLYNPTLVDSAPETTDELIRLAQEGTGDGRYGLIYEATSGYSHAPWMHAFGAKVEAMESAKLDDEAHAKALAFSRKLGRDAGIMPRSPTYELMSTLFDEGKASFVISGPWFVGDISQPIAAAKLPIVSETGEPAQPYLTVEAVFLADQAQNPDEATDFARWLSGPSGAAIRQDIGKQTVSLSDLPPSDDIVARVVREQVETAVLMPTDPNLPNVWEALERALRRVMRGAASPENAGQEAAAYLAVFNRPPPEPAAAWPYITLVALFLGGFVAWFANNLRDVSLREAIKEHRGDYLWVAPAGIAMFLLVALPFITGAAVSLFAHTSGEWTFVGLRHFVDILLSRDWPLTSPLSFAYTLVVTVLWTVTNVTMHVGIGVALALVLREPWIRLRWMWRALLIIPWAIPNYITALIWKTMFHVQYGAINALLTAVSGANDPVEIEWFGQFSTAFCANLITNTWLGFPFMMVVTLGALQSIPRDLEEAATVDGASYWFRFRHVIWPLLQPALMPAIIIGSVWTFNMFNVIYLVSAGEPDGSSEILISEAYRWAFSRSNRYGYAAAYAVIIFGVLW